MDIRKFFHHIISNIRQMPDEIYSEFFRRSFSIFIIMIILISTAVILRIKLLAAIALVICICLMGCIMYEYYLITHQKLTKISGTCIDIKSKTVIPGKSSFNYVMLQDRNNYVFKCPVSSNIQNKIVVGCQISIYIIDKNIQKDNSGLYILFSPLYTIVNYHTS